MLSRDGRGSRKGSALFFARWTLSRGGREINPVKILVVEDESRVRAYLEEALKREGHVVESCSSAEGLREIIEAGTGAYELCVLDRMLQSEDSLDMLAGFHKRFASCRILVLSALNSAPEKALALDRGADDYLAKPFSLEELLARLRALGRRPARGDEAGHSVARLRELVLDPVSRQAHFKSKRIDLSNKEFQVLFTLLAHPGRVYNKFQLLDSVWDTQHDIESNVVEVTIRNIRRKLEEAGCGVGIESKRNVGYWIEA